LELFFILLASGLTASKTYGNVVIRYKIKFYKPVLEVAPSQVSSIAGHSEWTCPGNDDLDLQNPTTSFQKLGTLIQTVTFPSDGQCAITFHSLPVGHYTLFFAGKFGQTEGYLDPFTLPTTTDLHLKNINVVSDFSATNDVGEVCAGLLIDFDVIPVAGHNFKIVYTFQNTGTWSPVNTYTSVISLSYVGTLNKKRLEAIENEDGIKQQEKIQSLISRLMKLEKYQKENSLLMIDEEYKQKEGVKPVKTPPVKGKY